MAEPRPSVPGLVPTEPPTIPAIAMPPAVASGVAAVSLSVLAMVVLADGGDLAPGDGIRMALAVAFSAAGLALLRRPQTRVLGSLTVAAVTVAGAEFLASAYQRSVADTEPARVFESLGAALVVGVGLHLLVALPDGRLDTTAARSTVGIGYGAAIAVGWLRWYQQPDPSPWPLVLLAVASGLGGLAVANRRYLSARGAARQRMQWLGLAVALCAEIVLVVYSLHLLVDWPAHPGEAVATSLVLVAGALAAAATPSFVGRIDRLLSHAVSLAGLTAVVTVIYFIVVVGLGRVPTDDDKDILVLSMAAAAVSAVVYPPARERLTQVADRLVYGEGRDPADALESFGARLTRAVPMDELLLQLTEQCKENLELESAEVWTGVDGRLGRAASVPERGAARVELGAQELPVVARARASGRGWAEIWLPDLLGDLGPGPIRIVPLVHTGELFGLLVLERPDAAEEFTEEEDRILTELARQIALALHNSELDNALQATLEEVQKANFELRESRARLVAAADLERRRIERDLHDGAQQHLVALAVKLRLIQKISDDDMTAAMAMVEEARTEALATVEELRALAHGIYPPLLMDRGLGHALEAAAGRATLPTTVAAEGVGRYRQEDEAAVYFCCMEAIQNATKHAGDGASVRVVLEQLDDELHFSVSDDGSGFDMAAQCTGHGFVNMGDRVGAIGGSLEVRSAPGEGTCVTGKIPVRPAG